MAVESRTVRPLAIFTGQWADRPIEEVLAKVAGWGYDEVELACWGDHFDVQRALLDDSYVEGHRALLEKHGLTCNSLGAHMVSSAVCDHPIDRRHQGILPARIWGDGDPEGVRRRAADEMKDAARAAAKFGVRTVIGFTGSKVWHTVGGFPPLPDAMVQEGYADFAERWNPIIDVFEDVGVRYALEVTPSQIAYDYWTTKRALDAIDRRPGFGINFDPGHLHWQAIDPVGYLLDFADRIYHVHAKECVVNLDGRNGILSSHLPYGDLRRGWDFALVGHGDLNWEKIIRALNAIRYDGVVSVEWDDAGMNRDQGGALGIQFMRTLDLEPTLHEFQEVFGTEPGEER